MKRETKIRKRLGLLFMIGIVVLAGGSALAKESRRVLQLPHFIGVDHVEIELKEWAERKNGDETILVPFEDPVSVVPGEQISKIPKITNLGQDCYVRAVIRLENGLLTEDLNLLSGIGDDWLIRKRSDFEAVLYYRPVLKNGESIEVFRSFRIPAEWGNEKAGQKFTLKVEAEAIQAENFTPDYLSDAPWGDEEILAYNGEKTYEKEENENRILEIYCTNEAGKMMAYGEGSYFTKRNASPGSKLRVEVKVFNRSSVKRKVLFRMEAPSEAERMLAKQIKTALVLSDGTKQQNLFSGTLAEMDSETHLLGEFSPGFEGLLVYELEVPKELDNRYADLSAISKWYFSVEEEPVTTTEPATETTTEGTKETTGSVTEKTSETTTQTGTTGQSTWGGSNGNYSTGKGTTLIGSDSNDSYSSLKGYAEGQVKTGDENGNTIYVCLGFLAGGSAILAAVSIRMKKRRTI